MPSLILLRINNNLTYATNLVNFIIAGFFKTLPEAAHLRNNGNFLTLRSLIFHIEGFCKAPGLTAFGTSDSVLASSRLHPKVKGQLLRSFFSIYQDRNREFAGKKWW